MSPLSRLKDLKEIVGKLSIHIETGNLFNSEVIIQSGYCKVKGEKMIILDELLSIEEQSEVILQTLKQFNLESVYLPAWVREYLETDNSKQN